MAEESLSKNGQLEVEDPSFYAIEKTTISIDDVGDSSENPVFLEKVENGWDQQTQGGSFVMKDGVLSWVQDIGEEEPLVLGDEQDWDEFSCWCDDQLKGAPSVGEKFEIRDLTKPHVTKVYHWEDEEHTLAEWYEMCLCSFDDLCDPKLMSRAKDLMHISKGFEGDEAPPSYHTKAVERCIAELRDFFVTRIEQESAFFSGNFTRECDYIAPQVEQFKGEQFRVRISRGGIAVATHVPDDNDVRAKFKTIRKNAESNKHNLLAIKVRKRIKEAGSKEELQNLLDFVRTIDPEESENEVDKKEFLNRKEQWIKEIEELLRTSDLPDEPEKREEEKRIIKGSYLPPVKLHTWKKCPPKVDKASLEASMLKENDALIAKHEKSQAKKSKSKRKKCKLKKGVLTHEQKVALLAMELDMSTSPHVQMTEEEVATQAEDGLDFHQINNLIDANIPAVLVTRSIQCTEANPVRKWVPTNIKVCLPVAIGVSGLLDTDQQEMVVCEMGKVSVYNVESIHRYNRGKNAITCDEVYSINKDIKLIQVQITKTHIGFLALCPEAMYQTIFILNRKTGNVHGFGTKTCPITCFMLDDDCTHVWLGFNHGLLIKMDIAACKRREQYWIAEEAPIQVIVRRNNRIVASTHKGIVLFNNGPGYENKDKRIIMPIGPVLDMRFVGNLLVVHRPDNSLQLLNLMTGDLEAFIPKPESFYTGDASTPYNSITMTRNHIALTFPEGNTLHFSV